MRATTRLAFAGAVLSWLAAVGAPALAGEDVREFRAALSHEKDPERRIALLPRIAAVGGTAAALALAEILENDPDVRVRAAAARALGRTDAEKVIPLLVERAREGGPSLSRAAVARALSERHGGDAKVLEVLSDPKTSEGDRVLLLRSLAFFADAATRAALVAAAGAEAFSVRDAAARALAVRRDARGECLAALLRLLNEARGREAVLSALDAVEPALDVSMRPVLERIAASTDAAEREAATYLLAALTRLEAANAPGAAPKPPADRYARPVEDDGDTPYGRRHPSQRARYDIVYTIDATGSTTMTLEGLRDRILDEMALLLRLGASVRVGVVAYRGGHGTEARRSMDILLPAFDPDRVAAFLRELKPGGVDERGAAVTAALGEALDRIPWRWDARRDVHLLADSVCDDPATAFATVSVHFRGDDTRTSICYVLRTRTKMPPEYADLARLGGTGVPETLK